MTDLGTLGGSSSTAFAIASCVDSDGDGLCDEWETNGVTVQTSSGPVFVNLPAMGANPMRRDIFVQTDYMVAPDHTHKPDQEAVEKIVQAFANAPASKPGGSTGITLHVDCGRSEEHTSELQSLAYLVCRLLLEKKKKKTLQKE